MAQGLDIVACREPNEKEHGKGNGNWVYTDVGIRLFM